MLLGHPELLPYAEWLSLLVASFPSHLFFHLFGGLEYLAVHLYPALHLLVSWVPFLQSGVFVILPQILQITVPRWSPDEVLT